MFRYRPPRLRIRSCFLPSRRYHNGPIAPDSPFFRISPEVRAALAAQQPVVALETTIYTHGFPHPQNLSLACELDALVRQHGGVPAHVGVLAGVARVGLNAAEIQQLVGQSPRKISRRDLAAALAQRRGERAVGGGTTIAGTMVLAHLAGIRVFATGGLGGVHRGGDGWDVSADLTELGRTPVAVVSGGCKGFLDVAATLEYLETQGVGVFTFGGDKVDYPAFWSRESGFPSPGIVRDEQEAARIIHAQFSLPLHSGLHFASPIPLEAEITKREMQDVIAKAINAAESNAVTGRDNTPFILSKIKELTNGRSISANRALIAASVKRGTLIAKELSKIRLQGYHHFLGSTTSEPPESDTNPEPSEALASPKPPNNLPVDILVAGALAVDCSCDFSPSAESANKSPLLHTSNPAVIRHSLGGVGHNVAKAAHYLGKNVKLCSIVGDDLAGIMARQGLREDGMDTEDIISSNGVSTAQYVAVNDVDKDLVLAMADMAILESADSKTLQKWSDTLLRTKPSWVVSDANWPAALLRFWLAKGKQSGAFTAYEPVSTAKSLRLFASTPEMKQQGAASLPVFPNHLVDLASPNVLELQSMGEAARASGHYERQEWWELVDSFGIPSSGISHRLEALTSKELVERGVPQQAIQMLPYIPTLLTKIGPEGVLLTKILPKDDARLADPEASRYIVSRSPANSLVGGVYMRWFRPPVVVESALSVNGAGDTFLGAILSAVTGAGCLTIEEAVDFAQTQAALTLNSREAVSPDLKVSARQRAGSASTSPSASLAGF